MSGYLVTESQSNTLHDCMALTIRALHAAHRPVEAATLFELHTRIGKCGGLAKLCRDDLTNIIAVLKLHQLFASEIPNAMTPYKKTDVADLIVLFTAAQQTIDQKLTRLKADKLYPCDTLDTCPFGATSLEHCRNNCGLGADDDRVDEADAKGASDHDD